jgi:hypothetical protein
MSTDTAAVFQTDRLPELRDYITREGMLLKLEALQLADELSLARKLLHDAHEKGCARVHLADWHDNIERVLRICNDRPIDEMDRDTAQAVLQMENSTLSSMYLQILKERKAITASAVG